MSTIGDQGEVIARQILRQPQGMTAVETWWYEAPGSDEPEIWCYTDRMSYAPGEEIVFSVHSTTPGYTVEIARDGGEREVVHRADRTDGRIQDTPAAASESGCGWAPTFRVDPAGWRGGGYVATVSATTEGRTIRHEHWFAIRPPEAGDRAGRVLLIAATSTWLAYNSWGGSNHYEGVAGPDGNAYASTLSLDRPWSKGMAWLPEGAPRMPNDPDPPLGWVPRYAPFEWAYANGFPKYYAAAGWAMYERHFVRWAERRGYTVDVITQHDLHSRPELLEGYRCVAIVGHDEYWTWEMRDHIDAYVDAGGNVARFAGNFLWQVRLDAETGGQTCFKYSAPAADPERGPRISSAWDDHRIGRPAARTLGSTGARGIYARVFGCNARGPGGYTVYRPNHWAFAGADLYFGDLLGAAANVFAYEVDGLDYTIRDGLPYPTGADGVGEDEVEILAMGLASSREEDHGNDGSLLYIGDADAAFVAEVLYGEATEATIERVGRGCGTLVTYSRGAGTVFNTGTVEWVNGLRTREPFIEQITDNVLQRFLSA